MRQLPSICTLGVALLLLTSAWAAGDDEEDDAKAEAKAARTALRKKVWERVHTRSAQKWYCKQFLQRNPDKGLNETNCRAAAFGGGSFIKLRDVLSTVPGVVNASLGYTGGWKRPVTYEEVCSDKTGHSEVVLTYWNKDLVNFTQLLRVFVTTHDPANKAKQGRLVGLQFRSVVFATTVDQMQAFREFREDWNLKAQAKAKGTDGEEPLIIRTEINRLRPANFFPEPRSPAELVKACEESLRKVAEKAGTLSADEKEKIEQRVTADLTKLKQEPRESVEEEREKVRRTRAARMLTRRTGRRPRPGDDAKAGDAGDVAKRPSEDEPVAPVVTRPAKAEDN